MQPSRRALLSGAFGLAMFVLHAIALPPVGAAQTFPDKPIRIVVPFAAGTAPDLIARLIADNLQSKWQQPIVVENKVGASGNIAAEYVAHSLADGATLLVTPPPPLSINQFLFKSLPFKPSDLTAVTVLASAPNVLVAKPTLHAENVADLVALQRTEQAKLNYASTGRGGTPHLMMEWLMSSESLKFTHVPYTKGLAPALNDLLAGHVDLMFANLSDVRAHVAAGKLKALGVTSAGPVGSLPGVQPISRVVQDLVAETWYGLAAPSGTPASVVAKISSDVTLALMSPTVSERLQAMSLTPVMSSPKDATAFVEADAKRWRAVIEKIGLQPE